MASCHCGCCCVPLPRQSTSAPPLHAMPTNHIVYITESPMCVKSTVKLLEYIQWKKNYSSLCVCVCFLRFYFCAYKNRVEMYANDDHNNKMATKWNTTATMLCFSVCADSLPKWWQTIAKLPLSLPPSTHAIGSMCELRRRRMAVWMVRVHPFYKIVYIPPTIILHVDVCVCVSSSICACENMGTTPNGMAWSTTIILLLHFFPFWQKQKQSKKNEARENK